MSESKPFPSLGPLLLARKGGASPAPGDEPGASQDGSAGAAPQDGDEITDLAAWHDQAALSAEPEVRRQQYELVSRIADANSAALAASELRESTRPARRAAFTLRLDAERHLKLKLASAVSDCSAQHLVIQALDRLLAEVPEIEALAGQVKRGGNKA